MSVVRRGLLVVFEGGDACGKNTQSGMLRRRLDYVVPVDGLPAKVISFPRYDTPLGKAMLDHLQGRTALKFNGQHEGDPTGVAPEDKLAFQCMMVAEKYHAASEIEAQLVRGGHVVCDRWWQSACVYGDVDGLDRDWLLDVHRRMPRADVNILLDVPARVAIERRPEARDRYEASRGTRETVRGRYLDFWETERKRREWGGEWVLVSGTAEVDVVHARVWDFIRPLVEERAR